MLNHFEHYPYFNMLPEQYIFQQDINIYRLNSGIRNRNNFFQWAIFYFKKVDLTQWIMPILGIPNFWSNSLGIRFWDFCSIFEIAWVAPICVGVVISKLSNALNFLCWSFSYIKLRVFIRFHVNPRNFYPRKIHFLAGFSVETI